MDTQATNPKDLFSTTAVETLAAALVSLAAPGNSEPDHDDEPCLFTVPEVAKKLRIERSGAYRLTQNGELPTVRLSERRIRVRSQDLAAYIDGHRNGSTTR